MEIIWIIGGIAIVILNAYLVFRVIRLRRYNKGLYKAVDHLMDVVKKNLIDQKTYFNRYDNILTDIVDSTSSIVDIIDQTDSNGIKRKISKIELKPVSVEMNIDDVLNKINTEGYDKLTIEEIEFLKGNK